MSLIPLTLDLIGTILKNVEKADCPSRKVASLGYPDILAHEDQIRAIFGDSVADSLEFRTDSAEILRWHNAGHKTNRVVDAASLFRALGWTLEVLDIVTARGGEIIHDLNLPIPAELTGRYALVIDAGTLEHCFNIGQAAQNIAAMVALGGAVMHGNPLNMFNHGFYNLNPTWYHDFYGENGFVIEYLNLVSNAVDAPQLAGVPPYQRFGGVPDNCTLLVVARRAELRAISWPVQRKYRDNPNLHG